MALRTSRLDRLRRRSPGLLAGILATAGVGHFIRPQPFADIVPGWIPRHREVVYASGLVELVGAAALVRRRRWATPMVVALLLAVWPANIDWALRETRAGAPRRVQAVLWARVPLQIPLLWMAWQARRSS